MIIKKRTVVTSLFFLFSCFQVHAQALIQDSRGKEVFEYYRSENFQASFAPTQLSLQANYNFVLGNPYYFYVGDTTRKTVGKANALSVTFKVAGSGKDEGKLFSVRDGLTRPTYKLELGWQRTLNTFYNIKLVPQTFVYSAGISGFAERNDLVFYDTLSRKRSSETPVFLGVHGHYTLYETKYGRFVFSVSGDLGKTYNQDNLTPFQERSTTGYIGPDVVSVGEVGGQIGAFQKETRYRIRLSIPVFVTDWLNITPYTSVFGYTGSRAKHLPGLAISFFNGAPFVNKSSLAQGFGLGFDCLNDKNGWSKVRVSLFGTLKVDKMVKAMTGKPE
jgi:hypothetical protein